MNEKPELTAMAYEAVVEWADGDFYRLQAVADARDYRPEWIKYKMEERGKQPSPQEMEILEQKIAEAGPYVSRRKRWILRQIREGSRSEDFLIDTALSAAEYEARKGIAACVRSDVQGLIDAGLVHEVEGKLVSVSKPNSLVSKETFI